MDTMLILHCFQRRANYQLPRLTFRPFQRSTQHLIEVSSISDLELSGKGRITILDQNRLSLNLGVTGDANGNPCDCCAYI